MTGADHYREAERLLYHAERHNTEHPGDMRIAEITAACAQVHATLALAAASAPTTDAIASRVWHHEGLLKTDLVADRTAPGDDVVWLSIHHKPSKNDLTVGLGPDRADELADDLKARAALVRGTASRAVTP